MNILKYLHSASFEPETLQAMGEVYDSACAALPDTEKEIVAHRIIALAKTGVSDAIELRKQLIETMEGPQR